MEPGWLIISFTLVFTIIHWVLVLGAIRSRDRGKLTTAHKNLGRWWLWGDRSLWRFLAAQPVVSCMMISLTVFGAVHLLVKRGGLQQTQLVTAGWRMAAFLAAAAALGGGLLILLIVVLGRPRFLMPRFLRYYPPRWD